jgi:hypothetical protein
MAQSRTDNYPMILTFDLEEWNALDAPLCWLAFHLKRVGHMFGGVGLLGHDQCGFHFDSSPRVLLSHWLATSTTASPVASFSMTRSKKSDQES